MSCINDLISHLVSNCEPRVLVAMAVYPRFAWTGELRRIDKVLDQMLSLLLEDGGNSFRIMHGLGVVLIGSRGDVVQFVSRVNSSCAAPEVELRSLIVQFTGERDASWLDEILGDLSVRGNFGRFSLDRVDRLIDDHLVTVD